MKTLAAVTLSTLAASACFAQLTNTGFDTGFVLGGGQAYVPSPWNSTGPGNAFVSFDTWDDTGANGLLPSFAGVFTGITANSGNRWAGGWHFEDMHQLMSSTLIPGQQYTISAWIHAPNATVGYVPGGWQFGLGATPSSTPTIVAVFPATVTWSQGWVLQSATFTAPSNSASLPYFFPQVYTSTGTNTYMGIDDVSIRAVPAPGAIALAGLGGLLVARRRRAA
ncbi:MAG: PEP-CTERM sorting domain-containing protein [Leptolyngbya sp. PLA1]|nr:PEP-CTERM sorting domain-containing protein [Leptolyngbya sp. PLA1]